MFKKLFIKSSVTFLTALWMIPLVAEDLSNIPQPLPGENVCSAYVSEYSLFGNHLENPMRTVRNLPLRYCRTGKALEGGFLSAFGARLRVAAVGDVYAYQPTANNSGVQAEVVNPNRSRVVCHARLVSDQGDITSLRNLAEGLCVAGLQFEVVINGRRQRVTVEAPDDFHYVPASETVFNAPTSDQLPQNHENLRPQPASLGIAI